MDEKKDRAASAMTSGDSGSKKKKSSKKKSKSSKRLPDEIHIRRSANKKFIATHHHHTKPGEQPTPSEDHVLNDVEELKDHVGENMQEQPEPAQPQSAAIPQTAGAVEPPSPTPGM